MSPPESRLLDGRSVGLPASLYIHLRPSRASLVEARARLDAESRDRLPELSPGSLPASAAPGSRSAGPGSLRHMVPGRARRGRAVAIRLRFRRPPPNRTGCRVGGWRGIGLCRSSWALAGNRLRPFPSAPLRTAHESFDLKQLARQATSTWFRSLCISHPSPFKPRPACLPSPCDGLSPPRTTTETP